MHLISIRGKDKRAKVMKWWEETKECEFTLETARCEFLFVHACASSSIITVSVCECTLPRSLCVIHVSLQAVNTSDNHSCSPLSLHV